MPLSNSRCNIAHIIDSLALGGAEKVAVDIVNLTDRERFGMHLIATTAEGPRVSHLQPHVRYFYLAKKHRYDFKAMHRLISYLRKNDIVIVHTHAQSSARLFSIASHLFGWKCIHVHSDHNPNEEVWKTQYKINRLLMSSIAMFFPVSRQAAEWERKYLNVSEEKQLVVWNGIETEKFKLTDMPGAARIVQIAGLRPQKNINVSLEAAKLLITDSRSFQWKVAGPWDDPPTPDQRDLLEQASKAPLSGYFKFLGPVTRIPELLSDSGIGVLTSNAEAMPISLCEYLAAGLPVVVSDIPIHHEIIGDRRIGLFAKVGNPDDFASKITWLMDNPAEAREMGRRGRELALEKLDIGKQISTFEMSYEQLIH